MAAQRLQHQQTDGAVTRTRVRRRLPGPPVTWQWRRAGDPRPDGARRRKRPPVPAHPGFRITTGEATVAREMKTSESVARDIVRDMVNDEVQAGDMLPSEAVMLDKYGVSRQSLREGLRLLEVQGLVNLRRGPGGGPVVGELDPAFLGRTATLYYHLAGATYRELLDAWVLAERTLAGLAAANPDRDAVRTAMAPFVDGTMPGVTDGVADFALAHGRFHGVVASLARNRVVELSLQAVGQIIVHHVVREADPREREEELVRAHAKIARAITAGSEKRARTAMEKHIRSEAEVYRRHLSARRSDLIDWH